MSFADFQSAFLYHSSFYPKLTFSHSLLFFPVFLFSLSHLIFITTSCHLQIVAGSWLAAQLTALSQTAIPYPTIFSTKDLRLGPRSHL